MCHDGVGAGGNCFGLDLMKTVDWLKNHLVSLKYSLLNLVIVFSRANILKVLKQNYDI